MQLPQRSGGVPCAALREAGSFLRGFLHSSAANREAPGWAYYFFFFFSSYFVAAPTSASCYKKRVEAGLAA